MKTLISSMLIFFLLTSVSIAQKVLPDKVPAPVKQAFMKEFPKAMEPAWRMDNGTYQVMFTLSDIKHAAKYDKTGQWIDKEVRINLADLPKEVTASIAKNFAGFKAYEAEQIDTPLKGQLFNVGLEKEKEFLEVHFSLKGDVLDKVTKTKKGEWGKDND
jgi:hypothetical protein